MGRFRVRYENGEIDLPLGEFSIGRSSDCDLSLRDPLASRKHAILHVDDEKVVVEDLGSANGVYVNERRLNGRAVLAPGDRVGIGREELVLLKSQASNFPSDRPTRRRITPADEGGLFAENPMLASLSPREQQVFLMVVHGHTHREVAEKLSISIKTVETYRAHIAEKLGMKSRAELVRLALDAGVLGS